MDELKRLSERAEFFKDGDFDVNLLLKKNTQYLDRLDELDYFQNKGAL